MENSLILKENLLYQITDVTLPLLVTITLCFKSPRDVLQDISKLDNLIKASIFSVSKVKI